MPLNANPPRNKALTRPQGQWLGRGKNPEIRMIWIQGLYVKGELGGACLARKIARLSATKKKKTTGGYFPWVIRVV